MLNVRIFSDVSEIVNEHDAQKKLLREEEQKKTGEIHIGRL